MSYGSIEPEHEVAAVARIIAHAFGGTREGAEEWITSSGLENQRVLRDGGEPVACLMRIPMAQYYGGISVPMLGIAGVGVAPEARGRGHARRIMEESVLEARREGFPLCGLYASTQALYRKVGYEQAGHAFRWTVPLSTIDVRERAGKIVSLTEEDDARVRACYAEFARRFSGTLDRGSYIWGRVKKFREERYQGFGLADDSGALEGYVFLTQRRKPDTGRHDVVLTDAAFSSAAAGRRLLGFLADFATVGDNLILSFGPHHPFFSLMPQQRYTAAFKDYWMIRINDPRAALEARAYAPCLRAEVHLDISDDLIPENTGRFTLRVREGRAALTPGGEGSVRLTIRALAAAYGGFIPGPVLPLCGEAEGDEGSLSELGALFGGRGTPILGDAF